MTAPGHPMKDSTADRAHELWSAAQLAPGEGIEDGVARIEALLARPAPAGEPEMPKTCGYLLTGGRLYVDRCTASEAGAKMDLDGRKDGSVIVPLVRADQSRAWGDARAEHARRVAMGYVLVPTEPTENMFIEGMEADCLGRPSIDDDTHVRSIWNAMLRAAAPPQGEPK